MALPEPRPTEIYYPESDHRPMAETDLHRDLMIESITALKLHFQDDPNVYVSGNLMVYYVEGHPEISVSPDVFVVKGVPNGERRVYKTWEEKAPDITLEMTSRSSHHEDFVKKRALYEQLGVQEYFIFDPQVRRTRPQLVGFRLEGGVYRPLSESRIVEGTQVFYSEVLGLELHGRGKSLRWVDPRTFQRLPVPAELFEQVKEETERAEAERERAEAERKRAEAERERADAEQERADAERERADAEQVRADAERGKAAAERGKAEAERERAETERERAEAEKRAAEAERRRADAAEAELARLREEISRLRGGGA